jgi:hypothetical protein
MSLYSITRNIFVGTKDSLDIPKCLHDSGITAIINVTGYQINSIEGIDIFDYTLPNQELMDIEISKVSAKLDIIINDINELRRNGRNILIICTDSKNKSILVAGYYLISSGEHYQKVIDRLEMLYFTEQQKLDEIADRKLKALAPELFEEYYSKLVETEKIDLETKRRERRLLKCLTMVSYIKVLRIKGGAKK